MDDTRSSPAWNRTGYAMIAPEGKEEEEEVDDDDAGSMLKLLKIKRRKEGVCVLGVAFLVSPA